MARPAYPLQVILNGIHIGVDICVDHAVTSSVSSTDNMDDSWASNKPFDMMFVVSAGQTIKQEVMKVRKGGVLVLCDGGGSIASGVVQAVTDVNEPTTADPVPSVKSVTRLDPVLYTTAESLAGDNEKVVEAKVAINLAGVRDQTKWAGLYSYDQVWALVYPKQSIKAQ